MNESPTIKADQMKLIFKMTTMLWFISIAGCGEQDKAAQAVDPIAFKTQREALDKAKQVESVLQDAAAQQRQTIDGQGQ